MSGFLQGLGQQAGYNIIYGQQKQAADDVHELRQQEIDAGKQQQLQQQAMAAARMSIAAGLEGSLEGVTGAATDDAKIAAALQDASLKSLASGDLQEAQAYSAQASQRQALADKSKAAALEVVAQKKEEAATASLNFLSRPGPDTAAEMEKARAAAGEDPTKFPKPGTPEHKKWAEEGALGGKSTSQRVDFVQKEADRKEAARARKEEQDRAERDMMQRHRDSLGVQQAMLKLSEAKAKASAPSTDAGMTPESLQASAAQVAAGMKLSEVVPGFGKESAKIRMAVKNAAVALILKENPTMSPEEAGRKLSQREIDRAANRSGTAAYSRTAAVTSSNISTASGEANKMTDLAANIAPKVNLSHYSLLNSLTNAVKRVTGDTDIVALDTTLNSLTNSYARAINPKGVSTDSDKKHARDRLNAVMSQEQLSSVFDIMRQEMKLAHESAQAERGTVQTGGGATSAPATGGLPAGWK
jgi:hypothetical protein